MLQQVTKQDQILALQNKNRAFTIHENVESAFWQYYNCWMDNTSRDVERTNSYNKLVEQMGIANMAYSTIKKENKRTGRGHVQDEFTGNLQEMKKHFDDFVCKDQQQNVIHEDLYSFYLAALEKPGTEPDMNFLYDFNLPQPNPQQLQEQKAKYIGSLVHAQGRVRDENKMIEENPQYKREIKAPFDKQQQIQEEEKMIDTTNSKFGAKANKKTHDGDLERCSISKPVGSRVRSHPGESFLPHTGIPFQPTKTNSLAGNTTHHKQSYSDQSQLYSNTRGNNGYNPLSKSSYNTPQQIPRESSTTKTGGFDRNTYSNAGNSKNPNAPLKKKSPYY
jgi:hypothetical protein